jgi:hypothetical protein
MEAAREIMRYSGTSRGWALLAFWLAMLASGLALFHAVGEGPLAAPPLDPRAWGIWLADRDALVATVALLRLVVLALTWYLVGATAIGLIARLARSVRAVRLADAMTIPALRRLLQASVGLSLATGVVVSAMPAGVAVAAPPPSAAASAIEEPLDGAVTARRSHAATVRADDAIPPALRLIGNRGSVDDAVPATAGHDRPAPPPLRRLDVHASREVVLRHLGPTSAARDTHDGGPVSSGTSTQRSSVAPGSPPGLLGPPAIAVTEQDPPPSAQTGRRGGAERTTQPDQGVDAVAEGDDGTGRDMHIVVAGESLWTVARDVVAAALGRPPSDAEVAGYWLELVEVQRPYLANPDDPDLIFPGERVRLPTTAGRWDR